MPWAIAIILGLLWALAMVSSHTFGGYVHFLIAGAVVAAIYQVIKNRGDNKFKKGV